MGLLDRYINNLTDDSMGPYSLTDEDKEKLKRRGLFQFGLNLLATPTGQGGVFQAAGKSLLNASNDVQQGGQDMMAQKFRADQMARQKAEFDKQKVIDGLAAKHRKPDGTVDMQALQQDYMAIDPMKFIQTGTNNELEMWNAMMAGLTPEEQAKAKKIKLKLEGGASSASIQYKNVTNPDGSVSVMAFDPNDPTVMNPVFGGRKPSVSPVINQPPKLAPEAQQTLNNIAMTPDFRKLSPLDQAKIADYITKGDFGFQIKNGKVVDGLSAGVGLPPGITPAEKARQEAQAKADVELATAGAIESAKTIGTETGKAQAAKIVNAPKVISDADSLIGLLDKAIDHPGRAAATGFSSYNPMNNIYGDGKDFNVLAEQIKGKTFLEAFNSLRGAGAITEKEGQAATAAIARLDMAQSEEAYLEALNELKGIVNKAKAQALRPVQNRRATDAPSKVGRFTIEVQ